MTLRSLQYLRPLSSRLSPRSSSLYAVPHRNRFEPAPGQVPAKLRAPRALYLVPKLSRQSAHETPSVRSPRVADALFLAIAFVAAWLSGGAFLERRGRPVSAEVGAFRRLPVVRAEHLDRHAHLLQAAAHAFPNAVAEGFIPQRLPRLLDRA